MKQRKHTYRKAGDDKWAVCSTNGHPITSDVKTEQMAQRVARGLDLVQQERRECKR